MSDDAGDAGGSAERLLAKVQRFSSSLDHEERALFAALLAPGIDAAWGPADDMEARITQVTWTPGHLPAHLVRAVRASGLRIEGDPSI